MEDTWDEIVVRQPRGIPGSDLAQTVRGIAEAVRAALVHAEGIEGAGIDGFPIATPLPVQQFLDDCSRVQHFDWIDVFLLAPGIDFPGFEKVGSYPAIIERSRAAIRVVDGEYKYSNRSRCETGAAA